MESAKEYTLKNVFRVMLLNPPAADGVRMVREGRCMQREGAWTVTWPPLTLVQMAAMLEKAGFKTAVYDCVAAGISIRKLQTIVEDFNPGLAIINTATPSIASDLPVARIMKKAAGNCRVGAIGIHVTVLPEEVLRSEPALDFVVRGEPEATVFELARRLSAGESDFRGIEGVSYRRGNRITHNPDRDFIRELDSLPFPAWHHVDFRNYIMPLTSRPFLLVSTSRGCHHRCKFCAADAYYGREFRKRSPGRVVTELLHVKEKYNVSDFLFWSESFTEDKEYALAVAGEIIRRKGEFRWVCNSRVDNVNFEMLRKFRQAGCWMIGYGIESGNQAILDRAGKDITVEQIEKAVQEAKRAGLLTTGHVIFGLPGETRASAFQTIKFLDNLDLDFCQFYCAVPFPGSELYQEALRNGWLRDRNWRKFEQNFSVINTGSLHPHEVMKIRKLAFRHFYLQRRNIMKIAGRLESVRAAFTLIKGIFKFLTWID